MNKGLITTVFDTDGDPILLFNAEEKDTPVLTLYAINEARHNPMPGEAIHYLSRDEVELLMEQFKYWLKETAR